MSYHRKHLQNDYHDNPEDDNDDHIIDESEFDGPEHHGMTIETAGFDDEDQEGVELVALSGSGSALFVHPLPYNDRSACRKRCCIGLLIVTMACAFAYAVLNYPLIGGGVAASGEEEQEPLLPPPVDLPTNDGGEMGDNNEDYIGGDNNEDYVGDDIDQVDINEVEDMGGGVEGEDAIIKTVPFATLQDGIRFEVLETLPHDPSSFTQGLSYDNGILYESTGLYKHSKVRRLNATTMEVIQSIDMPDEYFGEGLAYHNGKLIQITWKKHMGFVYDANDLSLLLDFPFKSTRNEGWGITHDEKLNRLIVSDGSEYLHFWDDETLEDLGGKVKVTRMGGGKAKNLNELEYWRGRVLANVWFEDTILVINPENGVVESEFDFSSLWPTKERQKEHADVLNGISISDQEDVLFVTGKQWKHMFKIRLIEE